MDKFDRLNIGILALQGDFALHERQLSLLGARSRQVKLPDDLDGLDGLIMPGGESTTMEVLMDRFHLRQPLLDFARSRPIYGTCAGMILLAHDVVDNQANVNPLRLIDIDVVRNGYGRQLHSFEKTLDLMLGNGTCSIRAAFIRAPKVTRIGESVKTLGYYKDSEVLVAQGNILASSFHAELGDEAGLLRHFLRNYLCDKSTA